MKNTPITLTLILIALTFNSARAFAAPGVNYSDGWVTGFSPSDIKNASASADIPEPQPESAEVEPQVNGTSEQPITRPEQLSPARAEVTTIEQSGAAAQSEVHGLLPQDYDFEKAALLARTALRNNINWFSGRCYEFVANFMEWSSIIKPWQWYSLGIGPVSAADFSSWANANPATMRKQLSLARMETPARISDLPIGGIVVYQRGACGFSSRHGHIEVVVAPNKLCSDGCQSFEASCLSNPSVRSRISVYVPVKKAAAQY